MAVSKSIQEKIEKHALSQLNSRKDLNVDKVNIHFCKESVGRGIAVGRGEERVVNAAKESVLVLVDHAPLHNWGHPCEIMLYDAASGEHYETYSSQFPPDSYFHQPKEYVALHAPVKFPAEKPLPALESVRIQPLERIINAVSGKRYAILFSGMSDNRHLNDLEFLYRTLLDNYGFDPADITVLNYDGTIRYAGAPTPVGNWPGNNTPYRIQINYSGTKQNMLLALDQVKQKLKSDDLLLIHTNNHGDGPTSVSQIPSKEADLCCYPNWDSLKASEFGSKIQAFPRHYSLIVMMEQCHSGGFKNAVLDNSKAEITSFAAACEETANSIGGANFDPFACDWIAAVTGNNPNGLALSKPVPYPASANDAFVYANAVKHSYDTPVYADKPPPCGKEQFLVPMVAAILDELPYNPNNLTVINEGAAGWLLTDGCMRMKMFDNEEDARNGLRVARRHNRQGFVGRSNPRTNRIDYILGYWIGNSGLPREPLTKTDRICYNPSNLTINYMGDNGWRLQDGGHYLVIAHDRKDAKAMFDIFKQFNYTCYIGRNNQRPDRKNYIMTYFE
jgi:hypothetical protein